MRPMRPHVRARLRDASLAAIALAPLPAAQSIALRRYDVPQGLAHSRVNCIFQDSRNFLWVGTWEGLSCFDGERFVSYGEDDGLGTVLINTVGEDPMGRLWVGTNGHGVARLLEDPAEIAAAPAGQKFVATAIGGDPASENVDEILFEPDGTPWCLTDSGVFRGVRSAEGGLFFDCIAQGKPRNLNSMRAACRDSRGRMWFGVEDDLLLVEGASVRKFPLPPDSPSALVLVDEDPGGRILAAHSEGLFEFVLPGDAGGDPWRKIPLELASGQEIRCLDSDRAGRTWVGTSKGLFQLGGGEPLLFTTAQGLPDDFVRTLHSDREGNLWIGTNSHGVCVRSAESIVRWSRAQGLPSDDVVRVVEGADGRIYGSTALAGMFEIRGDRAVPVPGSDRPPYDRIGPRVFQDSRGGWWVGADDGAHRFPGPELYLEGGAASGAADGFAGIEIVGTQASVCEDSAGDVWIATSSGRVVRRSPDGTLREVLRDLASPAGPMRFDRGGTLWIGARRSILRLRQGRAEELEAADGLPETSARAFFEDHAGRWWIGLRHRGVSMTERPSDERPRFRNWSTRDGLSSETVWTITEDRFGRIYLGTGRGLDRLDPETGEVEPFTEGEGLPGSVVNDCLRDAAGDIWIATSGGLARLRPEAPHRAPAAPAVYIRRVQVAGREVPLPERGVLDWTLPPIDGAQANVRIEFVGPSLRRGVAYEFGLEGGGGGFGAPTEQRSVDYGRLAPGDYRFLVRSTRGGEAARLAFEVLPPLWRRWWFLAGAAAGLLATAYGLHRARVRRILALEGIRTQIATDIHDDLGSGLAQIAILTEVAKREAPASAQGYLDEAARLARSMRDSMSDIVWAVDPRRDRFADLVQRMRQAAFNLLEAEGLRVEFRAPADAEIEGIGLAPDRRRHLLLALKETLANVARHARASKVGIEIRLEDGELRLTVQDDGVGFDPRAESRGNGLANLRRRAEALSGSLEIRSAPGGGTRVEMRVPLSPA